MGLIVIQLDHGFGRPSYYLTEQQLHVFMKYSYGEWLQVRRVAQQRFRTLTRR